MTIPRELLRIVRRKTYAEAKVGHRHGGKNFPPKNSAMFLLYKRLHQEYKHKPSSDFRYLAKAIKLFARSRRFDNLRRVASLERRFGIRKLGFELDAAIASVGVGAMRRLIFDDGL
jgi:hypothetical protein